MRQCEIIIMSHTLKALNDLFVPKFPNFIKIRLGSKRENTKEFPSTTEIIIIIRKLIHHFIKLYLISKRKAFPLKLNSVSESSVRPQSKEIKVPFIIINKFANVNFCHDSNSLPFIVANSQ